MHSVIHPDLNALLAQQGNAPLQAIIQLRPQGKRHTTPSAAEFEGLAGRVLDRVAKEVGTKPLHANLLKNLATLIVEGDADFIRSLVHQPEVISAIPNATEENPLITPIDKKPEGCS